MRVRVVVRVVRVGMIEGRVGGVCRGIEGLLGVRVERRRGRRGSWIGERREGHIFSLGMGNDHRLMHWRRPERRLTAFPAYRAIGGSKGGLLREGRRRGRRSERSRSVDVLLASRLIVDDPSLADEPRRKSDVRGVIIVLLLVRRGREGGVGRAEIGRGFGLRRRQVMRLTRSGKGRVGSTGMHRRRERR
jgi:hypothetical protein